MAAVLEEIRGDRWVHNLLLEWAEWARCAEPGSCTTAEGYLRERLDSAHDSEPSDIVALADRAVARMRIARQDYWKVFRRYYLNPSELSELEIGLQTGHNEDRVRAILRQSRFLVGHYLHLLQA